MSILHERVSWKRPKPPNDARRSFDLTPHEQANARVAIKFLKVMKGSWPALAKAMNSKPQTLAGAVRDPRRGITAGLALRAARVAGVSIDEILAGRWPAEGTCPTCGRGGSKS